MNTLTAIGGALLALASGTAGAGQILVPAYFYPSDDPSLSYWDELTAAASQARITAIMNPNNGPGLALDPNYATVINAFRGAGGQVVGYIHTSYGSRDIDLVKADIDRYASFYHVDGFFVDEMSNLSGDIAYYQPLYTYIKSLSSSYQVFGNPGIGTLESYLSIADTLVTFEGPPVTSALTPAGYDLFGKPEAWTASYPAARFGHLIYGVSDVNDMHDLVRLAATRNTGYLYITDDTLPNPWDTLPAYWNEQVAAVSVPEPATSYLFGAGLALAALFGRRKRSSRRT